MALTKNELVFDLLNIVRGGKQVNSELISEEQVSFWIDNTRAQLIKQDFDKGRTINPSVIQTIGCMDVSLVDATECGCQDLDCHIVRSTLKLPRTIETRHRNLIVNVGPIDLTKKRFSFIPYYRAVWSGNNKFTKNLVRAFLHNDYLYILNAPYLEKISVDGVFEKPEELNNFISCDSEPCYTNDSDYPLAAWMVESMKQLILQNDFRIAAVSPTDQLSDSKHNVQSQSESR